MRTPTARGVARGFSLLELLVALSIMAMALGLLYQASTGALRGVGHLDMDQRASLLAQSLLDTRDAVPAVGWRESGQVAGLKWQVNTRVYETAVGRASPSIPLLHDVRVVVEWEGRLGTRQLELHTLLPQERPAPGTVRR